METPLLYHLRLTQIIYFWGVTGRIKIEYINLLFFQGRYGIELNLKKTMN